jgi:hypothetical protein
MSIFKDYSKFDIKDLKPGEQVKVAINTTKGIKIVIGHVVVNKYDPVNGQKAVLALTEYFHAEIHGRSPGSLQWICSEPFIGGEENQYARILNFYNLDPIKQIKFVIGENDFIQVIDKQDPMKLYNSPSLNLKSLLRQDSHEPKGLQGIQGQPATETLADGTVVKLKYPVSWLNEKVTKDIDAEIMKDIIEDDSKNKLYEMPNLETRFYISGEQEVGTVIAPRVDKPDQIRAIMDSGEIIFLSKEYFYNNAIITDSYKHPCKGIFSIYNGVVSYTNDKNFMDRKDGPAYIGPNYDIWYQDNLAHRLDGPAMIYYDNKNNVWFYKGEGLNAKSQADFEEKLIRKLSTVKTRVVSKAGIPATVIVSEMCSNDIRIINDNGTLEKYPPENFIKLFETTTEKEHPFTGAFQINNTGDVSFKKNGDFHRADGPCYISHSEMQWRKDNMFHREDGPALIYSNGDEYYYYNGLSFTKEKYENIKIKMQKLFIKDRVKCINKLYSHENGIGTVICRNDDDSYQILMDSGYLMESVKASSFEKVDITKFPQPLNYKLFDDGSVEFRNGAGLSHREDGPAKIYKNRYEWYLNGLRHRAGGVAAISNGNERQYFENGKHHRIDGPAYIGTDGSQAWFYHGRRLEVSNLEDFKKQISNLPAENEICFDWNELKVNCRVKDLTDNIINFGTITEVTDSYVEINLDSGKTVRRTNSRNLYKDNSFTDKNTFTLDQALVNDRVKLNKGNGKFGTIVKKSKKDFTVRFDSGLDQIFTSTTNFVKLSKSENRPLCEVNSLGDIVYLNEHGQYHRLDGPAIETLTGVKEWRVNGNLHRIDGPAFSNGVVNHWYYNGNRIIANNQKEFDLKIDEIRARKVIMEISELRVNDRISLYEAHRNKTSYGTITRIGKDTFQVNFDNKDEYRAVPQLKAILDKSFCKNISLVSKDFFPPLCEVDAEGSIRYKVGEIHHRSDGPAIEFLDGSTFWYFNGKAHRANNLPAIERADGTKEYVVHGVNHRTDGPAIISPTGKQYWYYQGKCIDCKNLKEFNIAIKMTKQNKSFKDIFVQDATKASIRSGTTLGLNAIKTAFRAVLVSEKTSESNIKHIMDFFDTSIGESILRFALGHGMMHLPIPEIKNNKYAKDISEELRVSGMSKGMDKAIDLLKQFIVPQIMDAYKDTPMFEPTRVSLPSKGNAEEEGEEEIYEQQLQEANHS